VKLKLQAPDRPPGRPRDRKLDEAIVRDAHELFLESGYHATTITQIARKAGVGTPAIYRRWRDKADLAIEVLARAIGRENVPQTDSIRLDLVELMRSRIKVWRTPIFPRLLLPLMVESTAKPDIHRRMAAQYIEDMKPQRARVLRAMEEGQLRRVDPQLVLDMLGGPVAIPLVFNQPPPEESDAEAIVDAVLAGIAADKAPERQ
jgi:AcrR family transcriptional regulator